MGPTRERPGAEGPVRIAPPGGPSQGDSAILPGSIATEPPDKPRRTVGVGPVERLTLLKSPSYHPPDDERADAPVWAQGAFVCL